MTLTELRTNFRLQVPMATEGGITDSVLDDLLNQGVDEVNLLSYVYKKTFRNATAEVGKQVYSIFELFDDYIGMGDGILYYQNSSGDHVEIYPKTRLWFRDNLSNWRDASNGTPQYYYVDGDNLVFDVPFSSALTLRLEDYLRKSNPMGSGNHYPWTGTTTEIPALKAMDLAIIAYAMWRVQPTLGKDKHGNYNGGSSYKDFLLEVREGARKIRKNRSLYFRGINKMNFR